MNNLTDFDPDVEEIDKAIGGDYMTPEQKPMEPKKETKEKTNGDFKSSVHLDAYFKGFHLEVVEADPTEYDRTNLLIANFKKRVDVMIEQGFEPSWNKETSQKALADIKQPELPKTVEREVPVCGVHGTQMVWKEGVSKKTNKPYAFWTCPSKNADGSFCSFKPKV